MHRVNREQNVAAHSFNVALLCLYIATEEELEIDYDRLLSKALLHDMVESKMGDIPSPTKRGMERAVEKVEKKNIMDIISGLGKKTQQWFEYCMMHAKNTDTNAGQLVEIADIIDVLAYAREEEKSGNKSLIEDVAVTLDYIRSKKFQKMLSKHPVAKKIIEELLNEV
jgi:putative hydrolase of HD superfamily